MSEKKTNASDIQNAAGEALRVLAQASEAAAKTISDAASAATGVIAAAATAARLATGGENARTSADHDLLVELKTQITGIKEDIKNLRTEQVVRVDDHGGRLNSLEKSNTILVVSVSVGGLWLSGLTAMIVWSMLHVPIQ